jgi:peroxiredoxin Q/BCP
MIKISSDELTSFKGLIFSFGLWFSPWLLLSTLALFSSCATSEGEDQMREKDKAEVGNPAPDFTLPDQNGQMISLKDFHDKNVVVLYFYPKNNTSVCTAQACAFRDSYETFQDAGAVVIGISSDSVESHEGFAEEYQLPFYLLSDQDGKTRKRYGASAMLGIPGRVTFVIDKQGVIRHQFSSMFSADSHIEEALPVVQKLAEG